MHKKASDNLQKIKLSLKKESDFEIFGFYIVKSLKVSLGLLELEG